MFKKDTFIINRLNSIDYFIVSLFFVSIFAFLYFAGTLSSGYHLIDDHAMLSLKNSLINDHFWKTAFDFIKNDLNIRFRPLFYLFYTSEVQIFGINFLSLSIFTGILAFLSFTQE